MGQPDFTVDVYQNEHLPEGARDVNAIVTVTTAGAPSAAPVAQMSRAEIIVIDCSESMTAPPSKIAEAQAAATAALDVIRDGVDFAVIAGTDLAVPVYPSVAGLVVAESQTIQWAKRAVADLLPGGGTAMGQWLRLAHELFSSHPSHLRHATLLTDGKNDDETSDELDAAIKLCEGVFSCDCRGVGAGWEVAQLRRISAALLGTVDILPGPATLAADFSAMMLAAMGQQVADVALRIWTPQHASIQFVKQVAPTVEDLTDRCTQSGPQTSDYPSGAWGTGETRDYHLRVRVVPGTVGQEMLVARVSLITPSPTGPEVLGEGRVRAIWTNDQALSAPVM
jgi:von Willebrand factor type A domain